MAANNFDSFFAKDYLKEYYSKVGPENKLILNFLDETYSSLPKIDWLVELGGGQ